MPYLFDAHHVLKFLTRQAQHAFLSIQGSLRPIWRRTLAGATTRHRRERIKDLVAADCLNTHTIPSSLMHCDVCALTSFNAHLARCLDSCPEQWEALSTWTTRDPAADVPMDEQSASSDALSVLDSVMVACGALGQILLACSNCAYHRETQ